MGSVAHQQVAAPEPARSPDQILADQLSEFVADPLGHVLFAYPWGEAGTQLAQVDPEKAIRDWQLDFLLEVGEAVAANGFDGTAPVPPLRFATRSGHGPGKSALAAWLLDWILDTRPFCKGTVTATTATQLRTKTWAEFKRWRMLSPTAHWWHVTDSPGNMACVHKAFLEKDAWRIDGITCAETNSEAFAGQHRADSTSVYLFDEAWGVPDSIYRVAEGGLVHGEAMFFIFGNPTRARGAAHQAFVGKARERWRRRTVDSRNVEGTNKALIQEWIDDYGEDSDFVRVRVKGLPPKGGELQLISQTTVEAAQRRELAPAERWEPIIIGVDVSRSAKGKRSDGTAREGAHRPAKTVIRIRRGRDARSYPKVVITERAKDTEYVARVLTQQIQLYQPDAVMIDGDGIGGPLCDMMRARGFANIHEIRGQGEPMDRRYANLRTEMWHEGEKWLRTVGCIDPGDEDLAIDLTGPESDANRQGREQLESKESMLAREIASPDDGDALMLTHAFPVGPRTVMDAGGPPTHQNEYDATARAEA